MKSRIFTLALCIAATLWLGLPRVFAVFEVSTGITIQSPSDFYQPLAGYGSWIQVGSIGRCWHPAVTSEWRPYCNGYWQWTNCGWYWVSDEPWAWACYHYGTWAFDPTDGWVWVPGVEWAPAWVNWRVGDGYIGWAPCGPAGTTINSSDYVFVEGSHFGDHFLPGNVILNDPAIVSRTKEIASVMREDRQIGGRTENVFVNNGPGLDTVEKATGRKFTPVSVQKVEQTTLRSAPQQIKERATEAGRTGSQTTGQTERGATQPNFRSTQRPAEELPKTGSMRQSELPQSRPGTEAVSPRVSPQRQQAPAEKNVPPERSAPETTRERVPPEYPYPGTGPNVQTRGNRLQHPEDIPPDRNTLPSEYPYPGSGPNVQTRGLQRPEDVPPGKTPRQSAPPGGNGTPGQKNNDDTRDHNTQDHT